MKKELKKKELMEKSFKKVKHTNKQTNKKTESREKVLEK